MLLRDFIDKINTDIMGMIPRIKVFGLAQSVIRTVGVETEFLPAIVSRTGEMTYVGIDDVDAVRIYHRNSGVTTTRSTRPGTGDRFSDIINTYQMSMIVYIDHKLSKLYPEELFLFIQANMLDEIKSEPYKRILIKTTNVILNSQLVFAAEYAGANFKLPAEKSLFQVNYTIETTFSKECFEKCPADC